MRNIPALILTSLIFAVQGYPNERKNLGVQECALFSIQGEQFQYQVTDGKELVMSTWDSRRQLVSCSVDLDEERVLSFLFLCLKDRQQGVGGWDKGGFAETRLACQIFQNTYSPMDPAANTERQLHRVKRGFTYPGTLWCGSGNNAQSFEDLGEYKETDTCCRTHDQCEHVIHPFSYNYGYRNLRWHTISHCECDTKFKECLREVNDTTSRVVGQAFFNVIQVPCFEFKEQDQCMERYWYGWCKTYINEIVAVSKESGLYDYGGDLIDHAYEEKAKNPTPPPPHVEPSSEQPSLEKIMQATEDLLKLMMTVSPSTSSDLSKAETTTKKSKDKKKKERKHKKGKGLKGKRGKGLKGKKKNLPTNGNVTSPTKVFWGEDIKNDRRLPEVQPVDSIHDLGGKQYPFNDVLNDEPSRHEASSPQMNIAYFHNYEESKNTTTIPPQVLKPYTERAPKKSRQERKGRRQRKKKSKAESLVSEIL
ncbi:protein PROCA1 [Pelodytes ibericus]